MAYQIVLPREDDVATDARGRVELFEGEVVAHLLELRPHAAADVGSGREVDHAALKTELLGVRIHDDHAPARPDPGPHLSEGFGPVFQRAEDQEA